MTSSQVAKVGHVAYRSMHLVNENRLALILSELSYASTSFLPKLIKGKKNVGIYITMIHYDVTRYPVNVFCLSFPC